MPLAPIAATPMAMLWGEIILPAQAPVALEAAIQACTVSLAPIAWADPVWSLPKSTQEEVAEQDGDDVCRYEDE